MGREIHLQEYQLQLNALINQEEALRGKKLTDGEADHIISLAQEIINLIEKG